MFNTEISYNSKKLLPISTSEKVSRKGMLTAEGEEKQPCQQRKIRNPQSYQ